MSPARFIARLCFAAIWLINGLWAKVLGGVPHHQEIVARILGEEYAGPLTMLIGCAEIVFAIWILSGLRARLIAWTQIVAVLAMNVIEAALAPDLLLFGRLNLLVAIGYVSAVAAIELRPREKPRT